LRVSQYEIARSRKPTSPAIIAFLFIYGTSPPRFLSKIAIAPSPHSNSNNGAILSKFQRRVCMSLATRGEVNILFRGLFHRFLCAFGLSLSGLGEVLRPAFSAPRNRRWRSRTDIVRRRPNPSGYRRPHESRGLSLQDRSRRVRRRRQDAAQKTPLP
jgi:hypothetical protein